MKRWQSLLLVFIAGCVLAWLGVFVAGVAAALPWPQRLIPLGREHPVAVHYSATVVLYFMPTFLLCLASGSVLFRWVSHGSASLLAALLPHLLLAWLLGADDRLLHPINAFMFGLTAISVAALPMELVVAWWLSKRRPVTLQLSGRPPAGFAA